MGLFKKLTSSEIMILRKVGDTFLQLLVFGKLRAEEAISGKVKQATSCRGYL